MGRNRFVVPELVRLDLSDGDWVEVKSRLGIAEAKKIESAIFRGVQGPQGMNVRTDLQASDVELKLDPTSAYMAKLEVYIHDWSFTDAQGKHVKVSRPAIEALDPDTADEIVEKLNEYLDAQEEAKQDPFTKRNSIEQSA